MSNPKSDIEKFDGKNDFILWKIKMEAHLRNLGLDEALKGESKMSESLTSDRKQEILKKAKNSIILSLSDQILRKVVKEPTTAGMWLKLESLYMTKTLPTRIYLKQKFYSFKMNDQKSIDENVDEFTKLVSDLENLDVKIDDEDQAIFLLNSLPKAYEQLCDTLKYGRETLTLDEVVSAAYSKELDLNANPKNARAEGLNVRGRTEKREKGKKSKSRSKSKSKTVCWNCNKEGHWRRQCPEKKKNPEKPAPEESANVPNGLNFAEVLTVSDADPKDQWILDSGCSFHMTPRREWLFDYLPSNGKVLMGNNHICDVHGAGSVKIKRPDGSIKILKEVRYIPELKRNLISLGVLDKAGYTYKGQGGVIKIFKGILQALKGNLENGLYVLEGETITGEVESITRHQSDVALHQRSSRIDKARTN